MERNGSDFIGTVGPLVACKAIKKNIQVNTHVLNILGSGRNMALLEHCQDAWSELLQGRMGGELFSDGSKNKSQESGIMVSFSAFRKATLHHRSRTGLFSKTWVKNILCVAMCSTSETVKVANPC